MDAASIEEINKLRKAMGMKALPVPGAAPQKEPTPDPDAGSTIESREAEGYDNFKKVQDAEAAKRKREEKKLAVMKARELAQRNAVLDGKGIADLVDDDELDAKSWLKTQKKRQKKIEATKKAEEEKAAAEKAVAHTAADLAGVKVAHDAAEFLDADNQILTLKDTGVLDEDEEGDELENLELREKEQLEERLNLKKKKPLYDPNDVDETGERGILSQYDEEIHGKKKKAFTLDTSGASDLADILNAPAQKRKHQAVDVEDLDAPPPVSDYLDPSEVKVKKSKKKKSKSTRRKGDDEDALFPADQPLDDEADNQMDVDSSAVTYAKKRKVFDEDFVDDEDLQTSLALQRKDALKRRKRTRPEDIAKQLREEASQPPESEDTEAGKGMVIDEISEFVDALHAEREEERRAPKPRPKPEQQPVTAMDEPSDDEEMNDADAVERGATPLTDVPVTGVEDEKTVDQGLGATLALLKDRHLIEDQNGAEANDKFRQRQRFLAELQRRMSQFDEEARLQRERDRASGRHDRLSIREREELARQQNAARDQHQARVVDQLFREGYRPSVELKYVDGDGRRLDAKEAFKELSHQFHGKGSGKGKTDKRLKKLAEEKRRMAQSMLDASANVGMSTAASHQGKKRKEAGVRLA
ncbi:SART-1 protein [Schizothecium vesticola]|uniref:SART-1 protein n=1 Tax=Schizothecium vesticola TaxID=314040 RepID=A0AA40EK81_9PEZI|nr:SART-1 protein [Schizothecium vesticola]